MVTNFSNVNISCVLLNAQSVGNKTLDIHNLIKEKDFDVLAVTETWLSDYETAKIQEMTPKEIHTFFHVPRNTGRGGGVGIFLSNPFKKIRKKHSEGWDTFEIMQAICEINRRKLLS